MSIYWTFLSGKSIVMALVETEWDILAQNLALTTYFMEG